MPFYYCERRPSFLPLFAIGRLYKGVSFRLERGDRETNAAEARVLDSTTLELTLNKSTVLVVGDIYEPHEGFLGRLLHPKEIAITETPITVRLEEKSVTIKRRAEQLKDVYPLNRNSVIWREP